MAVTEAEGGWRHVQEICLFMMRTERGRRREQVAGRDAPGIPPALRSCTRHNLAESKECAEHLQPFWPISDSSRRITGP